MMYGIVELAGHMLVDLVSGSHQRHPLLRFSYFLPLSSCMPHSPSQLG